MLKSVASFAHLSRRAIALHPTRVHRTLSAISSSQTIASRASTVLLRREYASFGHQTASNSRKKFPLSAVALILGGLTLTSLGLWQFYTSNVNNFPEPIRSDLRKALYFQNYGDDPVKAEQFYRRAMEAALEHPDLKRDGPEVTGILIQFGTMLEDLGKKQDAVDVLTVAFEALVHGPVVREEPAEDHSTTHKRMIKMLNEPPATQTSSTTWDASQDSQLTSDTEGAPETETHHGPRTMDGKTLIKTIGIAQKLGDLLHQLKKDQQAERYYLWSVEQLLRSYHQSHNAEETRLLEARDRESLRREFNFDKLPSWMSKTDLGASLEALGGFYASKGRYSHAIPLYGKALSLTESKSCHSAVLMCNISDALAGQGKIPDAMDWAERGLKLGKLLSGQECDECCGVLLYNIGMLNEMRGDPIKAKEHYMLSKQHGLKTGFTQCIVESNKALKRMQETNEGPNSV